DVDTRPRQPRTITARDAFTGRGVTHAIVAHEKAAHRCARHQELAVKARPDIGLAELSGETDCTDDHDARVEGEILHDGIVYRPCRIVDEDVDAVGTRRCERRLEIAGSPIIDRDRKSGV